MVHVFYTSYEVNNHIGKVNAVLSIFFYTSKLLSLQCLSALNLASMKTGFEGGKIRIYENPENI